jgi:putative MATE family efflux protein
MQDLTSGSVTRSILKTASFMLVSMIFQTLYFLVDLYFVGRLGKDAVAAVSVAGNLNFIVLAATQMVGVGTTALVSHAVGRRDREAALLAFNQSQVLAATVGLSFLVVMFALRSRYAHGLAADAATARLASDYLGWFIPALAIQFGVVATGAALRGTGNFKPGMLIQSGSVVLNMMLAPVLIFGWGTGHPLGVAGAALATFISLALAGLAAALYVVKADGYLRFAIRDFGPRLALWGRMLKIGLPAGAEFALMGAYMMIVYTVTRRFGAAAQAGFGIGLRVVQAGFLPVVALGFAVSPVAGQNFGARKGDRVRETFRISVYMATALMVVFTAICHLFPEAMIRVFSRDRQVLAVGSEYLRIISINYVASGVIFVSSSMFQAVGNTLPSLFSSAVRLVLVGVPVYLLSSTADFQLRWIWYLSVTAVFIQAACNVLLLRREFARKLSTDWASLPVKDRASSGV